MKARSFGYLTIFAIAATIVTGPASAQTRGGGIDNETLKQGASALVSGLLDGSLLGGNKQPLTPEQKQKRAARKLSDQQKRMFLQMAEMQYELLLQKGVNPVTWNGFDASIQQRISAALRNQPAAPSRPAAENPEPPGLVPGTNRSSRLLPNGPVTNR